MARFDTDIECNSTSHIKYCCLLALPILLIWVISMPAIALIFLFKNKKEAKSNKKRQYFLILYQGLTPQCFYWEFVNILRKALILASLLCHSDCDREDPNILATIQKYRKQSSLIHGYFFRSCHYFRNSCVHRRGRYWICEYNCFDVHCKSQYHILNSMAIPVLTEL